MRNHSIARFGGAVAVAALTVTLAACSGGGQSVADACKTAEAAMSEVNENTNSMVQEALSGEADYAELFAPVQEALSNAESEITNEEVKSALGSVGTEFDALVEDLSGLELPNADDIDPTAPDAMEQLNKMQEDAQAASESLQERSQALMDAGTKLQELCNAG